MNDIYILGIETSCDETAAAVVKNGREVISSAIYSQDDLHRKYGGVVPEIAARGHLEKISFTIDSVIKESVPFSALSAIAVTYTPGLVGALLVGVSYAKALSYAVKKPLIGVNHLEGHICANYINNPTLKPPFLCLVASGGHTSLYLVKTYDSYEIVGQTLDDAAGEAFDKTARLLGLGYPGGKHLEDAAIGGNPTALKLPRALINDVNFSFSGLKSALANHLNSLKMKGEDINVSDIAASFQEAVVDALVTKTVSAAITAGVKKVALAGGVSVNASLRAKMKEACKQNKLRLNIPLPEYCTDNAIMIATRAYFDYCIGSTSDLTLNAVSRSK